MPTRVKPSVFRLAREYASSSARNLIYTVSTRQKKKERRKKKKGKGMRWYVSCIEIAKHVVLRKNTSMCFSFTDIGIFMKIFRYFYIVREWIFNEKGGRNYFQN